MGQIFRLLSGHLVRIIQAIAISTAIFDFLLRYNDIVSNLVSDRPNFSILIFLSLEHRVSPPRGRRHFVSTLQKHICQSPNAVVCFHLL